MIESDKTEALQSILNRLQESISVHNGKKILYVNQATLNILGYDSPDELLGMSVTAIVHPDDRAAVAQRIRTIFESGESRPAREERFLRKDGTAIIAEVYTTPIVFHGEKSIMVSARDITVRKTAEAEQKRLVRQEKQARREHAKKLNEAQSAIELRDEFISVASHEFKTPLTAFSIQLQTLMRLFDKHAAGTSKFADADGLLKAAIPIVLSQWQQLKKLIQLVDGLLDVSRLETGDLKLNRKICDLETLVRSVLERDCSKIPCKVILKNTTPLNGHWDSIRLEQVISNLLSNAVKYGRGKPIEIVLDGTSENAILQITDFGIGLSENDQKKIFERYHRATSIKNYGGLGLGLFISRQLIEAHGGTIQVESELDQWTRFTVQLPLLKGAA